VNDVGAANRQNIAERKALVADAPVVVEKIAKEIAQQVRLQAIRNGHSIGIRIVRRTNGVRITLTGPQAQRYRKPLEDAMRAQVPRAAAEIRVLMTRRAK
jgi:hypothetical protein